MKDLISNLLRRERMRSCAGAWSDLDTDAMIKDIYESRKINTRKEVKL